MHATAALLSLLALASISVAAPMPQQQVARAVPDLREVIRDPMPIDAQADINQVKDTIVHIVGSLLGHSKSS
ncbi:hypothetical protein ACN47E_006834 [Coniothyrium glycines]